ncbi:MAG: hypothetical protein ACK4UN_06135 [Limisphaerales bacterium]
MRNEAADIVQDHPEETPEWKYKAKVAGNAALDATKAAYQELHDRTLEYSKATDQAIRQSPYMSLGLVFGVGCLLGFIMSRGGSKQCED